MLYKCFVVCGCFKLKHFVVYAHDTYILDKIRTVSIVLLLVRIFNLVNIFRLNVSFNTLYRLYHNG